MEDIVHHAPEEVGRLVVDETQPMIDTRRPQPSAGGSCFFPCRMQGVGAPFIGGAPLFINEFSIKQGNPEYSYDHSPASRAGKWWTQKANTAYSGHMWSMADSHVDRSKLLGCYDMRNPFEAPRESSDRELKHRQMKSAASSSRKRSQAKPSSPLSKVTPANGVNDEVTGRYVENSQDSVVAMAVPEANRNDDSTGEDNKSRPPTSSELLVQHSSQQPGDEEEGDAITRSASFESLYAVVKKYQTQKAVAPSAVQRSATLATHPPPIAARASPNARIRTPKAPKEKDGDGNKTSSQGQSRAAEPGESKENDGRGLVSGDKVMDRAARASKSLTRAKTLHAAFLKAEESRRSKQDKPS